MWGEGDGVAGKHSPHGNNKKKVAAVAGVAAAAESLSL